MKKLELLILTLVLVAATAFAGIGTVAVGTAETAVVAASNYRTWGLFQNNSTNDIWLKVDSSTNTLTTNNGVKIPAGGGVLSITGNGTANPARNAIKAISATGTNTLTYQEGNEN